MNNKRDNDACECKHKICINLLTKYLQILNLIIKLCSSLHIKCSNLGCHMLLKNLTDTISVFLLSLVWILENGHMMSRANQTCTVTKLIFCRDPVNHHATRVRANISCTI